MSHAPDTLQPADTWRTKALCRDYDPDLFFPIGDTGPAEVQAEQAKAICHRCPVIDTCLAWAYETRQKHGVWGGLTADERTSHRRRENRAANGAKPRRPIPAFDTFHDAYTTLTSVVDGHVTWTGHDEVRVRGDRYSRNQAAWRATYGRAPDGRVFPSCDHERCVQHLTDQAMRDEHKFRTTQQLATA